MDDGRAGLAAASMESDDEAGVVIACWHGEAAVSTITAMADAVSEFAGRHGMPAPARRRLALAVAEAVADAVPTGVSSPRADGIRVEAATDRIWMSVWVTGDVCVDPTPVRRRLPLVSALADRVELGPTASGDACAVLMELPMGVLGTGRAGEPAAFRRPEPDPVAERPTTDAAGSGAVAHVGYP